MPLGSITAIVAVVLVSAVCTAGITGNVRSLSEWTVLVGLVVGPPLVALWRWSEPRPAMSESIRDARR